MNETKVVLIIEEVHMHASWKKMSRFDIGEPVVVRVMRQGQNFGMSCVVIDQSPSLLHGAVLANVATRIVMRLTNSPCVKAIGHSMGLTELQKEELVELPRRRALMQTADVPKALLIRVVDIQEHERPPEHELLERERLSLESLDHFVPAVDVVEVLHADGKDEDDIGMKVIRGDMHKVLARICENPCELIEDRSDAVGIERAREGRAREKLLKVGLIEPGDKVGSKWLLYRPTGKGIRWAQALGLEVPRFKSGVGHEYMVRRVTDSLGGFFGEEIEFFPPGEGLGICGVQPDLLAGMHRSDVESGWRMAVQISRTNRARYEVDRATDLSRVAQIDLVVIVAKNKGHRMDILRKIKEATSKEGLFARNSGQSGQGDSADASDAVRGNHGQGAENPKESKTHFQKGTAPIQVVDFETSVSEAYDWGWVVG